MSIVSFPQRMSPNSNTTAPRRTLPNEIRYADHPSTHSVVDFAGVYVLYLVLAVGLPETYVPERQLPSRRHQQRLTASKVADQTSQRQGGKPRNERYATGEPQARWRLSLCRRYFRNLRLR